MTEVSTLTELTAHIVAAHVGHNNVAISDIGGVIERVYAALSTLGTPAVEPGTKPIGAVSVRASIKPDHLVSMIDGKPYKMLRRHLSQNGYTPESYRVAFDLPKDYPMVAKSYTETRRALAIKIGLGKSRAAAPEHVVAKPARKPRAKTPTPTLDA
ncbi:Ros/MucR family transcriptional regulator [Sphingomonas immobilis]|uniref:MucR family transcriptional regulator n=1 Tax=Sphingomonas immobilis TaxID=3063997 RepID=A0ABT8ZW89_9SPHN|nr:MucR family transcriptional regulator [Sphingomonas sp. CA1-15]MDO7841844.1 MucR family transcriptional regulator [Sphingomonas sp. CA1-15]